MCQVGMLHPLSELTNVLYLFVLVIILHLIRIVLIGWFNQQSQLQTMSAIIG